MGSWADETNELSQNLDELFEFEDDDDVSAVSSNTFTSTFTPLPKRDEKKEVHKMSAKDTRRVQMWRLAMTLALLLTALGVTLTTYKFLREEENYNFETAFAKFSRTVGDAAVEQQKNLRDSIRGLAHLVSGYAMSTNLTWPMVTIPVWEVYARDALVQSGAEFYTILPRVKAEDKYAFTNFTTSNYKQVIQSAHLMQNGDFRRLNNDTSIYKPFISKATPKGYVPDDDRPEYWPSTGQFSPPPATYGIVNWNPYHVPPMGFAIDAMVKLKYETTFTMIMPYRSADLIMTKEEHAAKHSKLLNSTPEHPHTFAMHPIHRNPLDFDSEIVGTVASAVALDVALLNLLPEGVEGIHCIIQNNMNQTYTYEIIGQQAIYLGEGDMHETKYTDMGVYVDLALYTNPEFVKTPRNTRYHMTIYPSTTFEDTYHTGTPERFAISLAVVFVLVALVFFVYDLSVQRRNENLVSKAAQSNAIVSNLFPDNIRERLMNSHDDSPLDMNTSMHSKRGSLKAFLNDGKKGANDHHENKPLADLFLETTVLFADISGFTAWSSVREPSQVFTLLETIYQSFDMIAKRRRVFKVETVGDCYVAVTGLPEPRSDHACAMARFGRDILAKMSVMTKQLEVTLGPDTADLDLRIGMHSGPVTAGVLRGERARFQLFGDTMNTCARLEANSARGRILTSRETAELIKKAGKGSWVSKRDNVTMKGKGIIEAYWVNADGNRAGSVVSHDSGRDSLQGETTPIQVSKQLPGVNGKTKRLVDWNVEMLLQIMKQIVASRNAGNLQSLSKGGSQVFSLEEDTDGDTLPLEEVREIIALPEFKQGAYALAVNPATVMIPIEVIDELHQLVGEIATMYNDNPFHNFDHASHVVMSVIKLMSRIVAPSDTDHIASAAKLHDHTYGITSDPLTQFACAFSALIHDVDHVGVSNAQLVKEGVPIAAKYKQRSVAEQNSLDLSWTLLMSPPFENLRNFLFPTRTELVRFRQLVVNSVMSTDIVDKDLKALRNARWDKAFKKSDDSTSSNGVISQHENPRDAVNRKATIVIEHIIQASDISHTMQHWHVYRKWNQNLFEELYVAYLNGRMEKDPAEFWYKGEFGFFDFYIIPLTRKLKECGVFGVSSDEYLNYALKNREEWEARGQDVVAGMVEECRRKYGVKNTDEAHDAFVVDAFGVEC